jgi:tRNA modification GTPase
MAHPEETIAAIATAPGTGAIGIVRLSGPESEGIATKLFKPRSGAVQFKSHKLYHGDIVSRKTGKILDEVLIALMRRPHSYTGEDVLEIHCHGGSIILREILDEAVQAGARIAEPGEFTKRAFLNNRMDLSQAEAVIDLIQAKTERGVDLALTQLKGGLKEKIEASRGQLADVLADVEASLDFSDDIADASDGKRITERLQAVMRDLNTLLSSYGAGKAYRQGISAVIVGRTNVGKSSLLNRLLGEKRAIVSPVPGTTRDFIEEFLNIKGIPVKITDTAGIRRTEDPIEQEGIDLVWEQVVKADIILAVFDGSEPLTEDDAEVAARIHDRNVIPIVNKIDLPCLLDDEAVKSMFPDRPVVRLSVKFGEDLSSLADVLCRAAIDTEEEAQQDVILSNVRHKLALETALYFLGQATAGVVADRNPELVAYDIWDALGGLDDIIGKTTSEDILNRIFSTFCVGK